MDLLGALVESVLWSALRPSILVPAALLGWWARRAWVVVAGAVVIAAVDFGLSLTEALPPGAERVLWLAPAGILAPLGTAYAAFRLRAWLAARDAAAPASVAVRLVRSGFGAVLGAVLGGVVGLGLGLAVVEIGQVSSHEGASGYLVVFGFLLPGMLIGLLSGAVIGWRRSVRVPQAT